MNKVLTTYILSAVLGFAGTLAFNGIAKADEKPKFWYRHTNGVASAVVTPEPDPEPEEKDDDQKIRIEITYAESDVTRSSQYDWGNFHNSAPGSVLGTMKLRAKVSDTNVANIILDGNACYGTTCNVSAPILLTCAEGTCAADSEWYWSSQLSGAFTKKSAADFLNQMISVDYSVRRVRNNDNENIAPDKIEFVQYRYERPFFEEWLLTIPNRYNFGITKVHSNAERSDLFIHHENGVVKKITDKNMNLYPFESIEDEILHTFAARFFLIKE